MQRPPLPASIRSTGMHYPADDAFADPQIHANLAPREQWPYAAAYDLQAGQQPYATRPRQADYLSQSASTSTGSLHFQWASPAGDTIAASTLPEQRFPQQVESAQRFPQWFQQQRGNAVRAEASRPVASYSLSAYADGDVASTAHLAPAGALPRSFHSPLEAPVAPIQQPSQWPSTRAEIQPPLWPLRSPQIPQYSDSRVERIPETLLPHSSAQQGYPFPSYHPRMHSAPNSFGPTLYNSDELLAGSPSVPYASPTGNQLPLMPMYSSPVSEIGYPASLATYTSAPRIYSPQYPPIQPLSAHSTSSGYSHPTSLTPQFAQLPLQEEIDGALFQPPPQAGEPVYSPDFGSGYTPGEEGRSQDEYDFGTYPALEVPQASTSALPISAPPAVKSVEPPAPRPPAQKRIKKGGKTTHEEELICCRCELKVIGQLYFKGPANLLAVEWSVQYYCLDCAEHVAPADHPAVQAAKSKGEKDTKKKRSKRSASGNEPTVCLLCAKTVGLGGISHPTDENSALPSVGVICYGCEQKYQKCTDCGGAGIWGAGKWRAKQMFDDSRRTCKLDHTRRQNLEDTELTAREISTLTEDEKQYLNLACKHIFVNSMLSNLAIPEVMETGNAIMSSWQDLENHAEGGWARLSCGVLQPLDHRTSGRVRFVCLRWVRPNPRKKSKSRNTAPSPPEKIGPGHELAAFALAEYTLSTQDVYVSLLAPWTSGDGYDPSTAALQLLFDTIDDWRLSENELSGADEPVEGPILPISLAWTFLFLGRGDKLIRYMESKRQFKPLEKYLEQNPTTSRTIFPPIRPVLVPPHMQKDWIVLVKKLGPDAALLNDLSSVRQRSRRVSGV